MKNKDIIKKSHTNSLNLYPKYKQRNIITHTASRLLVYLQTSNVYNYKIIQDCKTNFGGYPLVDDEENRGGIKYMACVKKHAQLMQSCKGQTMNLLQRHMKN